MNTTTEVKEWPILFSTPMVQAILEGRKTMTRRVVTKNNSHFEGVIGGWPALDFNHPDVFIDGDRESMQYLHVKNPEWQTSHRVYPKYDPGDHLWVREIFTIIDYWEDSKCVQVMYEGGATNVCQLTGTEWSKFINWQEKTERKPSLYMFKSLCRLKCEIVSIGVERLQDITEEDAVKEGAKATVFGKMWQGYKKIDDQLIHQQVFGDQPPEWMIEPHPDPTEHLDRSAKQNFKGIWLSINGYKSWDANPWIWKIKFRKDTPVTPIKEI